MVLRETTKSTMNYGCMCDSTMSNLVSSIIHEGVNTGSRPIMSPAPVLTDQHPGLGTGGCQHGADPLHDISDITGRFGLVVVHVATFRE